MSGADYSAGLGAGYAVARRAQHDTESWIRHSRNLEEQIATLREKLIMSHAAMRAAGLLCKELADVVEVAAPTHALANSASRQMTRRMHLAKLLLEEGYVYDIETGELSPSRSGRSPRA